MCDDDCICSLRCNYKRDWYLFPSVHTLSHSDYIINCADATTESGSHFSDSILRWQEINLSAPFSDFRRDLYGITGDLPLLVLNQNAVVDILIKYLSQQGSLAYEPLLDLTVRDTNIITLLHT